MCKKFWNWLSPSKKRNAPVIDVAPAANAGNPNKPENKPAKDLKSVGLPSKKLLAKAEKKKMVATEHMLQRPMEEDDKLSPQKTKNKGGKKSS